MYIQGSQPKDSVLIPSNALIRNGKDYLVFVRTPKGFKPVVVQVLEERKKIFIRTLKIYTLMTAWQWGH